MQIHSETWVFKDDRYFLSGSLDGKLRLWHIPDKKVALWNVVEQVKYITAIAFVKNSRFVVVGTYDGRCFFYSTDQLKYHTVIDVRSTRGKNARGHKVKYQNQVIVCYNLKFNMSYSFSSLPSFKMIFC